MTFPLALHDFSMHDWSANSLDTILALLKGPLRGLKVLHEAGWMHRDISAKNILVTSLVPPSAVLCDYGKARQTDRHIDTHLGPIASLAPEVDGQNRYDNKIDIWGIGYVCCEILFPEYQHNFRARNQNIPPNRAWHNGAMGFLLGYAKQGSAESSFANLILDMLAWRPADRPTAAEALKHPCMPPDPPSLESLPALEAPEAKSQRTRYPKPEGRSGDTEPLTPDRRPPSFHSFA
jgi:serine/threonine protein kinase